MTMRLAYFVMALIGAQLSGSNELFAVDKLTMYDAKGKRQLVIEQGLSGNYIVRDSKGQRVGTGYKRMDGSIAIFDKEQKRIGTLEQSGNSSQR